MPYTTPSAAPLSPITENDIANYLLQTPDFFERHAEVLATVQLSSPHGTRAVSLQERQADLLREKIKALELRAAVLIRHGHDNGELATKLHRWMLALLGTLQPQDLPSAIATTLQREFAMPQVAIRVWGVAPQWGSQPFAQGVSDDVRVFAASLTQPYCGVNPGLEATSWLEHPEQALSLALVPLRESGKPRAFGLLVLAAPDIERFKEGMATDFLERLGELASAALLRLRP